MFFVSSVSSKGIEVIDTKDGVVESYSKEQIKDIARRIKIIGVTAEGIKSYSYEQIAKSLTGRLRLVYRGVTFDIETKKDGLVHFTMKTISAIPIVKIPFGVEVIDESCFDDWAGFEKVVFPPTLKKIKKRAFQYDDSLDMVIDIKLLSEIGIYAFQSCKKLQGVAFGEVFKKCGRAAFMESGVEFVDFSCGNIVLGSAVFKKCKRLKTVTVGKKTLFDSTEELFNECKSLEEFDLKVFRKTGGVAKNCFSHCIELKQVYNSDCITSISEGAFILCVKLQQFDFKNVVVLGDNAFEASGIREVKSGALLEVSKGVFLSCNELKFVDAHNAKLFRKSAFMSCMNLKRIDCQSVKEIGEDCFNGCSSVEKINLGVSVDYIGTHAFLNCTALKSLGKLRHIGKCGTKILSGADSLEEMDLVLDETTGEDTFAYCKGLKQLRLKTPFIGMRDFLYCENLEVLYWESEDVNAKIADFAFNECRSLREIHLPETLVEIGFCAFAGCSSLEVIHFPKSIKYIDPDAFFCEWFDIDRHSKVKKVYFKKGTDMSNIDLKATFGRWVKIYYEK